MSELPDQLLDTFEVIKRITDKLSRDELNAIMAIIRSYREEVEHYKNKGLANVPEEEIKANDRLEECPVDLLEARFKISDLEKEARVLVAVLTEITDHITVKQGTRNYEMVKLGLRTISRYEAKQERSNG